MLPEEEFFDAVDATLDRLDREEEKVDLYTSSLEFKGRLNNNGSQICMDIEHLHQPLSCDVSIVNDESQSHSN